MSAYQSIDISKIKIPEGRLRDIDQDWAECLAGMFVEVGHKTPIDIVAKGEIFELNAGGHRLAAAKICKWKKIDARILEPKSDQPAEELRLNEILENLARKDFNALERCEALTEMKRIYEDMHPETKHGGKRGNQHTGGEKRQVAIFAFCQNAAESTGLSARSVRLAVQIFESLSPQTRERLRGTEIANKQSDLKALAGLTAENQTKVLDMLFGEPSTAATVGEGIQLVEGQKPKSETEKLFRRVSDIMTGLPKASRTNVFRQHKKEIIALVKKEGWLNG
ncbi:ParB/RepB/Spo0J family partition protein [Roseibium album]|uniref:ParB/RepB/Spo0J family partition protein n=1 Tax=Roseibium album TaxID=311410 RepID=UPI00249235DC|nr:ParB N-terminal domain-containing protein [Roseibium album]